MVRLLLIDPMVSGSNPLSAKFLDEETAAQCPKIYVQMLGRIVEEKHLCGFVLESFSCHCDVSV